jgi:hypothetical protein
MSKVKKTSTRSGKSSERAGQSGDFPKSLRSTSEQVMRDIQRILESRDFPSIDEANAFLETLSIAGLKTAVEEEPALSPREQAQDLAWQATEASSKRQALALARQALAIDPDCVDALVVLAQATPHSVEELMIIRGCAMSCYLTEDNLIAARPPDGRIR